MARYLICRRVLISSACVISTSECVKFQRPITKRIAGQLHLGTIVQDSSRHARRPCFVEDAPFACRQFLKCPDRRQIFVATDLAVTSFLRSAARLLAGGAVQLLALPAHQVRRRIAIGFVVSHPGQVVELRATRRLDINAGQDGGWLDESPPSSRDPSFGSTLASCPNACGMMAYSATCSTSDLEGPEDFHRDAVAGADFSSQ